MSFLSAQIRSLFFQHAWGWLRQVGRSLRQLWHETTGTLFVCMGLMALPAAWKEWHRYQHGGSLWRVLAVALFMTLTFGYGIASFVKVRRMR